MALSSCCSGSGKLSMILCRFHGSDAPSPCGVPGARGAGASDGGGFDMISRIEEGEVKSIVVFEQECLERYAQRDAGVRQALHVRPQDVGCGVQGGDVLLSGSCDGAGQEQRSC
jgi:hypothetical protein